MVGGPDRSESPGRPEDNYRSEGPSRLEDNNRSQGPVFSKKSSTLMLPMGQMGGPVQVARASRYFILSKDRTQIPAEVAVTHVF